MTKLARVIVLTVAMGAFGCSEGSHEPAEPAEPAAAEGATEQGAARTDEAAEEGDQAGADEEPAEPEGEALEVVVKESHLRSSIPTDDETVVDAQVDEGTLEVHVENLEAACGPVPELTARLVDERVVLRLVPPDDRHCIGRQEIKIRMDLPRHSHVATVQLRGADGREVVTVDVPTE